MAAAQPRTVLVLYGSETGNAQELAEELGRACQRLHFQTTVEEMNAVALPELLQNQLVIFVISTTGQGDMPHNSTLFWKRLLQRRLPADCLTQVRYTCFGLGDSTYVKFNWAARKLIRRLDQLGASTFYETFEADEQFPDGIEGSFARWSDGLSKHLLDKHPHPQGLEPIPNDVILPPRWSLEPALRDIKKHSAKSKTPHENGNASPEASPLGNAPPADLLHIAGGWTATLAVNERTTPASHWQDVRLVSFDVHPREPSFASGAAPEPLRCHPGDCLTIYPRNFPADAERLIALMGWDDIADEPLDLSKCGSLPRGLFVPPSSTTLRQLLLDNIDITAIPRRSFLKSMAFFSTDEYHRERLLEFTLPDYVDEYFDYATRSRRTIIEVLEEFTSVRLPAARLLDIFPLIRGRDFSIANGGDQMRRHSAGPHSDTSCTQVDLLVAMVRYRTVLRKPREGLCSRYLASLSVGATLTVTKKDALSPVYGAACARRPLIALVTGTGVAPVRSLIHERLTHQAGASAGATVGPMILFFGNRNRAADYFFESEWAALGGEKTTVDDDSKDDRLLTVFPAFSRDQREKVYVQDLVRREAAALAALIPQRPIFAVCGGSSRMAEACRRAVWEPFLDAAGGDEAERVERRRMLDEVTWWQEIW